MQNIEELYQQWLDEQHGKWFVINFNNNAYSLLQYTKTGKERKCIDIVKKPLRFSWERELATEKINYSIRLDKRDFNPLWFEDLNPYYNEYIHKKYLGMIDKVCVWVKPVSNKFAIDLFNKIKEGDKDYVYNQIINLDN